MKNQTLEADLVKVLKKNGVIYTRLRTPGYGYRGVRYPADFVLWLPNGTFLIECKQRKELPIRPSDIRQLPFIKEWVQSENKPKAGYLVLTSTEEDGYCLFTCESIASAAEAHKGLKKADSCICTDILFGILEYLRGSIC